MHAVINIHLFLTITIGYVFCIIIIIIRNTPYKKEVRDMSLKCIGNAPINGMPHLPPGVVRLIHGVMSSNFFPHYTGRMGHCHVSQKLPRVHNCD